jgi:hypothetical protein
MDGKSILCCDLWGAIESKSSEQGLSRRFRRVLIRRGHGLDMYCIEASAICSISCKLKSSRS